MLSTIKSYDTITRKTKKIASLFDWVHTVDSLKIAERLNEARPSFKGPLNVCLQVFEILGDAFCFFDM